SLLVIRAMTGDRFRIDVRPQGEDWGGDVEVLVSKGEFPATEGDLRLQAASGYWQAVEERSRQKGKPLREARALAGKAEVLQKQGSYAEVKPLFERALAIREKQLGPEHPKV